MNKELKFVTSVLTGLETQCDSNLNWYYILGFAQMHKIAGALYVRATASGVDIPAQVLRKLKTVYDEQKFRVEFMRSHIKNIACAVERAGVEHVFLKGSVLAHTEFGGKKIYADGERVSNDIDVLVRPSDITEVTKVLNSLGFKQGYWDWKEGKFMPLSRAEIISRRMNRGETAPFILLTDSGRVPFIEADVNFSVDYLPVGQERLTEAIIASKKRYCGALNNGVYGASPEWFFLHLILHQYKESVLYFMAERGKESDLYKLWDIYLLLHSDVLDLQALHGLAEEYGLTERVCSVLQSVQSVFGGEIPYWANRRIKEPRVIMPSEGREFVWTKPIGKRISEFNKLRYLREIK